MIIVDNALEKIEREGKPIRVGLVGSGFAGSGFAMQLLTENTGMKLVAISNRTLKNAETSYKQIGIKNPVEVNSAEKLDKSIKAGKYAITSDPFVLTDSENIDVIVEATGEVEFGAQVVLRAIKNEKHVVLINAELDATIGPILKVYADKAGVVYTQADGDQPAVLMNLFRYVKSMGFRPVMVGNIKSLIDTKRTPETQKAFAKAHFQGPKMITSFADGTKIGMEMATIANATGFPVSRRGMEGPRCFRVEEAVNLFDHKKLLKTGLTDYILGAEPSFGVFVLAHSDHPLRKRYMKVYKMGDGPFYTFYAHCHLSPLEAPRSVARAVVFKDAALAPIAGPVCDVVTIAKKDLKKGEILDGIGGFTCYGMIDNHDVCTEENLLPMGLSDGCVLKRDVKTDTPVTYADVELPKSRLSDKLREEQNRLYG